MLRLLRPAPGASRIQGGVVARALTPRITRPAKRGRKDRAPRCAPASARSEVGITAGWSRKLAHGGYRTSGQRPPLRARHRPPTDTFRPVRCTVQLEPRTRCHPSASAVADVLPVGRSAVKGEQALQWSARQAELARWTQHGRDRATPRIVGLTDRRAAPGKACSRASAGHLHARCATLWRSPQTIWRSTAAPAASRSPQRRPDVRSRRSASGMAFEGTDFGHHHAVERRRGGLGCFDF
jgi:hypothetical protein